MKRRVGLVAFLLSSTTWILAQQPSAERYIEILDNPERVERLQVGRVIETLGLRAGQRIADVGAGSGLFTLPLARAVGEGGAVYAVDVDEELLEHIRGLLKKEGLDNVQTVLAGASDPRIPRPVDLIFICDTLHHIENRDSYLKGLRPYLNPGGRIAVIDFKDSWPGGHEEMRFTVKELEAWMREAGFRRTASYDFIENNFFLVYE